MAANMSWGAFGKATELRQRIWFTLGLLIIYRIGTYIPVPGIDGVELRAFFDQAAYEVEVGFGCRRKGYFDLFHPDLDQGLKELELACRIHGLDQ